MADEIQETTSIGDWGDVLREGLDIFGRAREMFDKEGKPVPTLTPEPVAAKPIVATASPLTFASPLVIVAGIVIVYFLFIKK